MPTCRSCTIDKDVSEFYLRKDSRRLHLDCKACISSAQKLHYQANSEAIKARVAEYASANANKRAAYQASYREAHASTLSAQARDRYSEKRGQRLREFSEYYQASKFLIRERTAQRVATAKTFVSEIKSCGCADCGGVFPSEAMDFDHVQGVKKHNVAQMVGQGFSIEAILEEIAKCDLVCANCHRVRTMSRKKVVNEVR